MRHLLERIAARLGPPPRVTPFWSPYLDWLTFANAGMLVRGNVASFKYALDHLPSAAALVEVGSFCGLSTNVLTYLLRRAGLSNPLFACDPWTFEGAANDRTLGDGSPVTHMEYRRVVKEAFLRNVTLFSGDHLPHTIESTADEFFAAWDRGETRVDVFGHEARLGGAIAFAYIDGSHEYGQARRDFQNVDRHLERGGFVLLDDSGDRTECDVRRVVAEVKADGRYEVIAHNPNYLFRKR